MPNLGMMELVVIFVIALLVFGPKKLPELGKSLGKGLREFKRATEDLKSNWDDQMREAERSIQETKAEIKSAADSTTTSHDNPHPAEPQQQAHHSGEPQQHAPVENKPVQ